MKFAKTVFWIAAAWGVLTITPLYFMFNFISHTDPPAITHPGFFYGFAGCALAWQLAFLVIATNPARYRPFMIPSFFEKLVYGATVIILVRQGRMHVSELAFAATDLILGVMFVIAYFKTPGRYPSLDEPSPNTVDMPVHKISQK